MTKHHLALILAFFQQRRNLHFQNGIIFIPVYADFHFKGGSHFRQHIALISLTVVPARQNFHHCADCSVLNHPYRRYYLIHQAGKFTALMRSQKSKFPPAMGFIGPESPGIIGSVHGCQLKASRF